VQFFRIFHRAARLAQVYSTLISTSIIQALFQLSIDLEELYHRQARNCSAVRVQALVVLQLFVSAQRSQSHLSGYHFSIEIGITKGKLCSLGTPGVKMQVMFYGSANSPVNLVRQSKDALGGLALA